MVTASQISRMLSERAEDVCRHLLPSGKRKQSEWIAGDCHGSEGDSLKVKLTGDKSGVWCDFANSSLKGDLIDLWMACRGMDLKDAITECKEFLGVKDDGMRTVKHVKKSRKPLDKSRVRKLEESVMTYLVNERMINEETIARFKVAQSDKGELIFPFLDEDGEVVMIKYLAIDRISGKKQIYTSAEPVKCLFGKNACDVKSSTLCITEGEIDAMSLRQLGYNAVSVPFGAKYESKDGKSPNDEWISEDYGWLARYSKLVLFLDQDEPGKAAIQDIIKRLGRDRCYVVTTEKGKDANQLLTQGYVQEIHRCIEEAKTIDPQSLKHPKEFQDDVMRELFENSNAGIPFPFDINFKIRKGELTLWTGFNGHGKSAMLLQTMLHTVDHGERICIISLEVPPPRSMLIMVHQHMRMRHMERSDVEQAFDELNEHMWFICHVGSVKWKGLLEEMRYAHMRYGINQFSVDSMLKCGISSDDYNGQKEFIDALTDFVNDTGCHVHLVAHSRKAMNEDGIPSKMDIHGSADITNLCYNGITVWRNKAKEVRVNEAKETGNLEKITEATNDCDSIIKFWKQRNGDGSEPFKRLFYKPDIYTFWCDLKSA